MLYCVRMAWERRLLSPLTWADSAPVIHQLTVPVLSLSYIWFSVLKWFTTLCFCILLKIEEVVEEGPGMLRGRGLLYVPQMLGFSVYRAEPGGAGPVVDEA